ncbi:molybdopterin cofactor-binding domain-containing protein [Paraburkholderia gardini]|uniref:molybdopterin cofactor-binding domain-containing protein n=1 Tax=Paraburkholderia gardini TaxID=2823469 RepID=UPI001D3A26AF|nr:molybdopterin cofactor-binding domain-containing protein [Paraburkholderia gardini]CAG4909650.1 hypothetical protein R69919_03713 [Paraburkholderia gardini]
MNPLNTRDAPALLDVAGPDVLRVTVTFEINLACEYGGETFDRAAHAGIPREGVQLACGAERCDAITIDPLLDRAGIERLDGHATDSPEDRQQQYSMDTHSAVFTGVCVTRIVSAVAAGRIANPEAAASQIAGGLVWGISMALREGRQFDHDLRRVMNHNLPIALDKVFA